MTERDDASSLAPRETDGPAGSRPNRRFALWAAAALIVPTLLLALFVKFAFFGEGFHAVAAVILGVGATIGLAVALMGLTFHSNRSGHDKQIDD